ncbi:MAG: hypothetical protein GYB65_02535, partial [Chloroflexi bacterium]|nr:hypothetical protein [Chloroflexota bacterium]
MQTLQRLYQVNDWPFTIKIGVALVVLAVLPLVVTLVFFNNTPQALEDEAFNHLEAVAESRLTTVDLWFGERRSDVRVLGTTSTVIEAITEFEAALHATEDGPEATLETLRGNYLGQPELDDAGDGSAYSASHTEYHPFFTAFLNNYGYYDVFLIEDNGDIVYSVLKEDDYGTNLLTGPYKDSNLATGFQQMAAGHQPGLVLLEDFQPYAPSDDAPASFLIAPVYDRQQFIGVLAVQVPLDQISAIMSAHVGLGDTGEAYLVGPNHLFRNDSRFLDELGATTTVLNPD